MRRRDTLAMVICASLTDKPASAVERVFFDDAETDPITAKWAQDDSRAMCRYVTGAHDGVVGPFAGMKMIECNDPGPDADWETLKIKSFSMNDEVFYRARIRVDNDNDDTGGSTRKALRIFYFTGDVETYVDVITPVPQTGPGELMGMYSDLIIDGDRHPAGAEESMYWGDGAGDHTGDTSVWHTVEYYLNRATGDVNIWHDDVLVQSGSFGPIMGGVGNEGDFYITSNWGDGHDATNHAYFDNVEIFTDTGEEAVTGTLAGGDVEVGVGPGTPPAAPSALAVQ